MLAEASAMKSTITLTCVVFGVLGGVGTAWLARVQYNLKQFKRALRKDGDYLLFARKNVCLSET